MLSFFLVLWYDIKTGSEDMELPFKYIVFYIMNLLNERNMPLIVGKKNLFLFCSNLIINLRLINDDGEEIRSNFNFCYELNDLLNDYCGYFSESNDSIVFDDNCVDNLEYLLLEEREKIDIDLLWDIEFILENDTAFLEMIGVKIRKEFYVLFLTIEQKLERCYMGLCDIENENSKIMQDKMALINDIKKLTLIKRIMLHNMKVLLPEIELMDLLQYATNKAESDNDFAEVLLLVDDMYFGENDIVTDAFQRSIFTAADSYKFNLRDCIDNNVFEDNIDKKASKIKFYLTFLGLLE